MGQKLLGTAFVLFLLSAIFLIARDNLSLEDSTASKRDQEVPPDGSESQG